jgi:hypothetical protein
MLTKKEWCVVVMAGCWAGLGMAAVVLAAWWLWLNMPVLFWIAVCVGCAAVLPLIVTWCTAERRARRQELWICQYCGKLQPLEEHITHRCVDRGQP